MKKAGAPKNTSPKIKNASTDSTLPTHGKTAANIPQNLLVVGI
jgi:hypothetical protein